MRKQVHKVGLLSAVLAFAFMSGSTVLALPPQPTAHAQGASNKPTSTSVDGSTAASSHQPAQATDAKASGQAHLAAAQLKACQKRETAINNIMSRISDRGQKQLDLFTSIATRTETFYTDKGTTLSNYDALVTDVTAKKAVAQTSVDAVKGDSITFKCDGTDPKGMATVFKEALKSEITALKDYKTAVKNLIVGVKSAQGATTSADNKTTGGNQ